MLNTFVIFIFIKLVHIDFVPSKNMLNMSLISVKVKGVNFNFHLGKKKNLYFLKATITMLTAKSYNC